MADWLEENSITDTELVPLAGKGLISDVTIIESEEAGGYYVTMRISPHRVVWRKGGWVIEPLEEKKARSKTASEDIPLFHLATRRIRTEPRIFKNLGRLVEHLREKLMPLREAHLILVAHELSVEEPKKTRAKVSKTARKT